MTPYDPKAKCPKCGGDDIATLYNNGCTDCACGVRGISSGKKHICRHCCNCHHQWPESCIDAEAKCQK